MRKIWFLILVLAATCNSWAQSGSSSWQNLSKLQAGQKIQVLEKNARQVSGTFLNVSETAISVQDQAGSQAIQRQDVLRVKRKNRHRLRNTFIGAGVGAGAGVVERNRGDGIGIAKLALEARAKLVESSIH